MEFIPYINKLALRKGKPMPIKTKRDSSNELTEHVVKGFVTDDEMFACEADFYKSDPTKLQLWDMSAADLGKITSEGLRKFVSRSAQLGKVRKGGRTAVIVRTKLQYGLGRMAEIFGEVESLPFAFSLFRKRDEAVAWLKAEADTQTANGDNDL